MAGEMVRVGPVPDRKSTQKKQRDISPSCRSINIQRGDVRQQ
jgi:hypothetical protein